MTPPTEFETAAARSAAGWARWLERKYEEGPVTLSDTTALHLLQFLRTVAAGTQADPEAATTPTQQSVSAPPSHDTHP